MSDDTQVYVGRVAVPDAPMFGWQNFCDLVFSEADFLAAPLSRLPLPVRQVSRTLYIDGPPERLRLLAATAAKVRKRLLIQGYTPEFVRHSWENARERQVETYRRWDTHPQGHIAQALDAMEQLTFEGWQQLIREEAAAGSGAVVGRVQPWSMRSLLDAPADVLVQLSVLADALPREQVWMDCSFLYDVEEEDGRTPHELAAEEQVQFAGFPSGKIIVLTEGKSDTRIITAGLRALYPEFAHAYQFIDFEEFRIEGGASVLARMVKVLAGARMDNRLLAIFDNDAAGHEAMRSLSGVRLPPTVRLIALPDTRLASRYPCLGPAGLTRMNVNGTGAAIELYLGRKALSGPDGRLRPVRWREWKPGLERYQGSVTGKDGVIQSFEEQLAGGGSPAALRRTFPELDLLLRSIFSAFEDLAPPVL